MDGSYALSLYELSSALDITDITFPLEMSTPLSSWALLSHFLLDLLHLSIYSFCDSCRNPSAHLPLTYWPSPDYNLSHCLSFHIHLERPSQTPSLNSTVILDTPKAIIPDPLLNSLTTYPNATEHLHLDFSHIPQICKDKLLNSYSKLCLQVYLSKHPNWKLCLDSSRFLVPCTRSPGS